MKLVYTEQALFSFKEMLAFMRLKVSHNKLILIRDKILDKAELLIKNPFLGQKEELLAPLGLQHRRLIVDHCKIIYRIENGIIFITDIFDSRQDPKKMNG
ncbi:MAG: hypothetical protein DRH21_04460 [Deltaproteobacteria bacterium]|nr:MAG: hypothetical protein DRH21_04460 [Deltaproteobacteria bacterium]